MKIFFFVESGLGISRLLVTQALYVKRLNSNIVCGISSFEQEKGLIEQLKNAHIEILQFNDMEWHQHFWYHVKLLRLFAKEKRIEIIHCQTNWQLIMAFIVKITLLLLHKQKIKLLYTIHGYRNNKSILVKLISKYIIELLLIICSDKVIATCESIKNEFKFLEKKITIINLGIDDIFINHEAETNGVFFLNIIYPARFREGKRQDLLIQAFAKFINRHENFNAVLFLPGDGEGLDYCKQLVNRLKIKDKVCFPGLLDKYELLSYYDKCNIMVCSSISETYCQSLVEAYCLGKCIISTPVGIATELIQHGISGYIFNSEEDLIDILEKLSTSPILLSKISNQNKKFCYMFSWSNVSNKYLELTNELT